VCFYEITKFFHIFIHHVFGILIFVINEIKKENKKLMQIPFSPSQNYKPSFYGRYHLPKHDSSTRTPRHSQDSYSSNERYPVPESYYSQRWNPDSYKNDSQDAFYGGHNRNNNSNNQDSATRNPWTSQDSYSRNPWTSQNSSARNTFDPNKHFSSNEFERFKSQHPSATTILDRNGNITGYDIGTGYMHDIYKKQDGKTSVQYGRVFDH